MNGKKTTDWDFFGPIPNFQRPPMGPPPKIKFLAPPLILCNGYTFIP